MRSLLSLTLGAGVAAPWLALAKPLFSSSDFEGTSPDFLFADLDGDHLKDAVLLGTTNVLIFYQDAPQGFPERPQQRSTLTDVPCFLWPARLGTNAESLLAMTSEGVTALEFSHRTSPAIRHLLLQQHTTMPAKLEPSPVIPLKFSAETGSGWPLLLVPVAGGFQIWRHQDDAWRQTQFINQSLGRYTVPSVENPGFAQRFLLSFSLSDVNGDGREDFMVMRDTMGGQQTYALYLQQTEGRFSSEADLTYTNQGSWRHTLCWMDLNRDGKVDLLRGKLSDEPFFMPGLPSGKALITVHLANSSGRIPAEPQQVFRKNDWSAAAPVVDLDGDGRPDLVLGSVPIDTREGLRKLLTTEQQAYTLRFYYNRPDMGFPRDPDGQREVLIHFSRDFITSFDRTFDFIQVISFLGDLNGDGKKDLLVKDHSDEIQVFFFISREEGFSPKPNFTFHCPQPVEQWETADLNGDGISDVMVKLQKRNAFRAFVSQPR